MVGSLWMPTGQEAECQLLSHYAVAARARFYTPLNDAGRGAPHITFVLCSWLPVRHHSSGALEGHCKAGG